MAEISYNKYETLKCELSAEGVLHIQLNRPKRLNAVSEQLFREYNAAMDAAARDSNVRCIVVSGSGKSFCSGLDLTDTAATVSNRTGDVARDARTLGNFIGDFQQAMGSSERTRVPVIICGHNHCIGAAIDMMSACDIRLCSKDAKFSIKEVDIGMAADVGTLQWFPKIVGSQSKVRELVYTGRVFAADEAKEIGFVSNIYETREEMMAEALKLATSIAEKSPVAVATAKETMIFSRDHSVEDGLKNIKWLNMSQLQGEDLMQAIQAKATKEKAVFAKL